MSDSAPAPAPASTSTLKPLPPPDPEWGVFVYLAGDLPEGDREDFRANLQGLFRAGASEKVAVLVQYDGPGGTTRYILPVGGADDVAPAEPARIRDSGSAETLRKFLDWCLLNCSAPRIAVVIGGWGVPRVLADDEPGRGLERLFTVCWDSSTDQYIDAADLAVVLRQCLGHDAQDATTGPLRRVDILALDSCQMQFLELAYELEGLVDIVIASQTYVPRCGWDYEAVMRQWHSEAAKAASDGTEKLACALVPLIAGSYLAGAEKQRDNQIRRVAVSALDLRRLDETARALDTFFISLMQNLGEGLVWQVRRLLLSTYTTLELGDFIHPASALPDSPRGGEYVPHESFDYDCGSLLALNHICLHCMADEAVQGWLVTTIERDHRDACMEFRRELKREIALLREVDRDRTRDLEDLLSVSSTTMHLPGGHRGTAAAGRRQTSRTEAEAYQQRLVARVENRVRDLAARPSMPALDDAPPGPERAFDELVQQAVHKLERLLPQERRADFRYMLAARDTARRLARQAARAGSVLLGGTGSGLVLLSDERCLCEGEGSAWPRRTGVSIYRPVDMYDLSSQSYRRFAFHDRIHWASLLGAGNLISSHPRALWRLVSSLLATGGPATRRDLQQRLTGRDSVMSGLRDQFRVMVPGPCFNLSLERREPGRQPTTSVADDKHDHYLLRLESATRGAVVTEQRSRVQVQAMESALRNLDDLLAAPFTTRESLSRLRAFGSLLGDDILQKLGPKLEGEKKAALQESGGEVVHLQLQIPRELMRFPWELMQYKGHWLSEQFALGRQIFMESGLARRVPHRRAGRVRPLIIGDPLRDPVADAHSPAWPQLEGARREAESIAAWFDRLRGEMGGVIDFDRSRDTRIGVSLTCTELRDLLRSGAYDIVHFAGHGVFDPDFPEDSAWILSDGRLEANQLRNTLENMDAPPWLVFANACEAAMESAAPRYQGSVYGLATAFINHGVAAYIAPLWPVDDGMAQMIALEFYRQLLSERVSLGEALRLAKALARTAGTPADDSAPSSTGEARQWASLGWASMVLYGDPTEELFHGLAGGSQTSEPLPARRRRTPHSAVSMPVADWSGLSDADLRQWLSLQPPLAARAAAGKNEDALELVEEQGVLRWRVVSSAATAKPRRGEAAVFNDPFRDSFLNQLLGASSSGSRSSRGTLRVIGRWIISLGKDGLGGLVAGFDKEQVPEQRLLAITDASSGAARVPFDKAAWDRSAGRGNDRILLLVHGTFSKTNSPVEGLGDDFLSWAASNYRAVIGFDHWTLSVTPRDNAEILADALAELDLGLLDGARIDIIAHSRGGLVARAFSRLDRACYAVKHLICVATPNCGTDLANPANWARLADMLVNLTGLPHAEMLGRLAGLLARLAVRRAEESVPGLLAQNPATADEEQSFLRWLQDAEGRPNSVKYAIISAEFEPAPFVPNLKKLLKAAAASAIDEAVDCFFAAANDLVVNTTHVWGIGQRPPEDGTLPGCLRSDRVLLFSTPESKLFLTGIKPVVRSGVHHCNLFRQPEARSAMRKWLMENPTSASRSRRTDS